jgi:hypothetical protein
MAENISKEKRKKKKRRNRIRINNLNLAANLLGHANKAQANSSKKGVFLFLTQSLFMVLREYFFLRRNFLLIVILEFSDMHFKFLITK